MRNFNLDQESADYYLGPQLYTDLDDFIYNEFYLLIFIYFIYVINFLILMIFLAIVG